MALTVLNQIVAIEKDVKSRVYGEVTELFKAVQKPELLYGLIKTYQKVRDDSVDLPPESKKVQFNADDVFARVAKVQAELFDITATKEYGNTGAFADVVVDDKVIVARAPVTFLLFLEKQLSDLRDFVDKFVGLSDSREWNKDPNTRLWKTAPETTVRTEKVQEPLVLYPATKEHAAQTQLVVRDVIVGNWSTVHWSGAIPTNRKQALVERIEKLRDAVKSAREKANMVEVERRMIGKQILEYIFQ